MNRLIWSILPLAAPLVALSGCIFYDRTGKCWQRDHHGEDSDGACVVESDTAGLSDGSGDTGASATPSASFSLAPDEADAGEAIIASLTVEGEFDLAAVTEVEVFGDVTLLAAHNRGSEILLSIAVDDRAADGSADLLLHIDGDAVFVEGALILHAAKRSDSGDGGDGDGGDDADCTHSSSSDPDCS